MPVRSGARESTVPVRNMRKPPVYPSPVVQAGESQVDESVSRAMETARLLLENVEQVVVGTFVERHAVAVRVQDVGAGQRVVGDPGRHV